MQGITQKQLKEILEYCPEKGIFTWKVNIHRKIKRGNIAGTIASTGHVKIGINKKMYYAHRLAWLYVYGKMPNNNIDHKDRNPANNKIDNLRDVSQSVNCKNKRLQKNNKSGFSGICNRKSDKKWEASFTRNKKRRSKRFDTKKEAVQWRVEKMAENNYLIK